MTVAVAGETAARRSMASMPLIPGRRTAMIATSGWWASAAAAGLGAGQAGHELDVPLLTEHDPQPLEQAWVIDPPRYIESARPLEAPFVS